MGWGRSSTTRRSWWCSATWVGSAWSVRGSAGWPHCASRVSDATCVPWTVAAHAGWCRRWRRNCAGRRSRRRSWAPRLRRARWWPARASNRRAGRGALRPSSMPFTTSSRPRCSVRCLRWWSLQPRRAAPWRGWQRAGSACAACRSSCCWACCFRSWSPGAAKRRTRRTAPACRRCDGLARRGAAAGSSSTRGPWTSIRATEPSWWWIARRASNASARTAHT